MTTREPRPCWQNCSGADDDEVHLIDAMEDSLGPLDEQTIQIRRLITLFEACYHEADREAEFIAAAIGAGNCPQRSNERPAQRKKELEDARDILSTWCRNPAANAIDRDLGAIRALSKCGKWNGLWIGSVKLWTPIIRITIWPWTSEPMASRVRATWENTTGIVRPSGSRPGKRSSTTRSRAGNLGSAWPLPSIF
jgi:hypothetical protein